MTATHATRVVNLRPRIDRAEIADRARNELAAAIITIHRAEHAGVTLTGCANDICRKYVALRLAEVR